MTEAAKLINALTQGEILRRNHKYPDGTLIGSEYFFMDVEHKYFESKGWGSALGTTEERLESIIKDPQDWEITQYSLIQKPWSL